MSSASKSKTKSRESAVSSAAVKEHLKDSVKSLVSTIGTFHRTENAVHGIGHLRAVDDCDTHSGSSGTGQEYDSVSNNGSYSGESEDIKEKAVANIVDSEKREKIRLRNEKKHQRQRERRAQELHERCCNLLMSRKLESLSRQLVAMGFSSERATAALMMNDGKLEESVSWLLEGNTEMNKKDKNVAGGCSLKIDITDELARVAAMETRFNCSKKDVERAVVSSEGDIQKAEEVIRKQKQESLLSSRSEETNCDSATPMEKSTALESLIRRKSERDLNFPNTGPVAAAHSESAIKPQHLFFRENHASGVSDGSLQPSSNFTRNTFPPAASVLLRPSTGHISTAHVANNVQQTSVREQLVATKHPQSRSVKPVDLNPGRVTGSYSTNIHGYESLVSYQNGQANQNLSTIGGGDRHVYPQQSLYRADHRQQDPVPNMSDTSKMQLGNYSSRNPMNPSSPTLNPPSSLGLFSSSGNSGGSSHVDWNHVTRYTHGEMPLCDYASIDWTMNSTQLAKSTDARWIGLGLSSTWKNVNTNGDGMSGYSASMMSGRDLAVGSNEWTSPFGGRDIFSAPRQCVNSSSLW